MQDKWLSNKADEIQSYADKHDSKRFYESLEAVYGPQSSGTSPLLSADGTKLLTEKQQILERWAELFNKVLNCPASINDSAIARLPHVETNNDLDNLPTEEEVRKAIKQLSCSKAPGADVIPAENKEEKQMLTDIIANFQEVCSNKEFHLLQKGIIHGDFHDYNIIVDWPPDKSGEMPPKQPLPMQPMHRSTFLSTSHHHSILQKYGIIDFEEMSVSYPAFELSHLVADMMVDCELVECRDVGGHVLAGYMSVNRRPLEQFRFGLYKATLACLAKYIILFAYEYQRQGGSNEYCLLGTEGARALLIKLKAVKSSEVHRKWGEILACYGLDYLWMVS